MIAAYNPATVGSVAWEKYPNLRAMMEMCITNHFRFPPPTMALLEEDSAKESQLAALEKVQILEFETHLAAASTKATITEHTSLLLPQLTFYDPIGPARRPPASVLASLQAVNDQLHLGHRLCRSRNPDFLLDVIQRQGASQAMPWLADLVESSEGALRCDLFLDHFLVFLVTVQLVLVNLLFTIDFFLEIVTDFNCEMSNCNENQSQDLIFLNFDC